MRILSQTRAVLKGRGWRAAHAHANTYTAAIQLASPQLRQNYCGRGGTKRREKAGQVVTSCCSPSKGAGVDGLELAAAAASECTAGDGPRTPGGSCGTRQSGQAHACIRTRTPRRCWESAAAARGWGGSRGGTENSAQHRSSSTYSAAGAPAARRPAGAEAARPFARRWCRGRLRKAKRRGNVRRGRSGPDTSSTPAPRAHAHLQRPCSSATPRPEQPQALAWRAGPRLLAVFAAAGAEDPGTASARLLAAAACAAPSRSRRSARSLHQT